LLTDVAERLMEFLQMELPSEWGLSKSSWRIREELVWIYFIFLHVWWWKQKEEQRQAEDYFNESLRKPGNSNCEPIRIAISYFPLFRDCGLQVVRGCFLCGSGE
jgi:hypothetical protein